MLRRVIEVPTEQRSLGRASQFYVCSLSARVLVYKGMLLARQMVAFYPDLADADMASAIALVHARFSTNVLPRWDLAQPMRFSAHNGEINTLRGNVSWMRARASKFHSPLFGDDIDKLGNVIDTAGSDSSQFDNALELLVAAGRPVEHAMMMMIPQAWEHHDHMDAELRAFYEFHASILEPWDGPAAIAFTDGRVIGATLDRNGLRPARYVVTHDGLVVLASEAGVLDLAPKRIARSWRLEPGSCCWLTPCAAASSAIARARRSSLASTPTGSGSTRARSASQSSGHRLRRASRTARACWSDSRPSATPTRTCGSCSPPWRSPAKSRWARWATTRRSRC